MDAIELPTLRERMQHSSTNVVVSLFHCSQLLSAGVGIGDTLDDVRNMEKAKRLRRVWSEIAIGVKSGSALSRQMSRWPAVFDNTVIALVRVGEHNGELASAFMAAHDYLQWSRSVRGRFISVLIYPLLSLVVLLLVVGFLFVSVVPAVKDYLVNFDVEISWHTAVLIHFSEWLQSNYPLILALLVLMFVIAIVALRSSDKVQLVFHAAVLHLPLLGRLSVELSLSRYSQCCASLYSGGVLLEDAMKLSEPAVHNLKVRRQLSTVREGLVQGRSLGSSLSGMPEFPAFFKRMISIGESTGALEAAFFQVSEQQQQSSQATIDRVQQLTAPMLMLLMGSCVLWIVISMLAPVYSTAINAALQV
ncbi:MAG: type II secretion system F family protein [Granulosicoccus sp.]